MRSAKTKLVLSVLANVAVSFPMFLVGGAFIFSGDAWFYLGLGAIIYAVVSCVLLFFTLVNPASDFIKIDRFAMGMLGILFVAAAIFKLDADGYVLPFVCIVCLAIKWASHSYVFRSRVIPSVA